MGPAETPSLMHISTAGTTFIKTVEGLRLTPYKDSGGKYTVGYGHTANVWPGDNITEAQAEQYLQLDISAAEHCIVAAIAIVLQQCQFDALCSLIFNIGVGAFGRGSIAGDINRHDFKTATAVWGNYCNVGGVYNQGLRNRRLAEIRIWNGNYP
jgi:lysozyme